MNFKTFLEEMLLEGGAALKTAPITQTEAKEHLPKIVDQIAKVLGIKKIHIQQLGSAGKKPNAEDESGDVDLAIKAEATDVEKALPQLACDGKTFKAMKGINVYSFAYQVGEKKVQVDLMPVSNPMYASWASQANEKDLKEGLKGSHRNELFFACAKHIDPHIEKYDSMGHPLIIKRYFYDLQKGLMLGVQTREGKKKTSKNFKTIEKKVITDDPAEITKLFFGDKATPDQVSTFRGTLAAIKSPSFPYKKNRMAILEMAKEGMKKKGLTIPDFMD